jgi:hypothetical protein
MKFLELAEETEKALASICDAALKAGGLAVHHLVNQLTSKIKQDSAHIDVPPSPVISDSSPESQG